MRGYLAALELAIFDAGKANALTILASKVVWVDRRCRKGIRAIDVLYRRVTINKADASLGRLAVTHNRSAAQRVLNFAQ